MSLEISVREITVGLASVRVNERKKNAETLKEFLTRNAVPSLLSENTLKKKGYTWNDLFDDINDYILKETEKFETSKNFESVICPLCTSLLHLCVAGSNKGQAFIKCDKITEACLIILKEKRLTKAIGDAYLNLLYKYVLSYDHYSSYITPSTWVDLLDVSISACISNYSKLDDFTKLRLVFLVIKSARNHCQFVIPLRDSLLNLKRCFFKLMNDKRVQEVLVEIMLLLLEMLSPEYRLTMCEFTEDILSCILKIYDQNLEQKKKPPLFCLLQMTVELHHPQGKFQNEEGSLASDWSIWMKHLNTILEIVCLEIVYLQKSRKQNEMSLKYCKHFFQLAASVYFQIFNILLNSDDNIEVSSSKRQKVTFNKNKTFRDLINELRENHIPWFGIIQVYIKKYGSSVTMEENLLLVNIIESLITNNSSNFSWDILKEITCLIVQNLSSHRRNQDECDHVLLSLWNSCVRNSSLNGAHRALHTVMQHLLKFNKLHYQNIQPLIKLYFEKGIPVTDESVMTLNHIFQNFYDKCSNKHVRLECFAWLIEGQIISISINNLKELLLRLISNQNFILPKVSEQKSESNILYDTLFNSIEKCMLYSEFEFDIPKSLTEPYEALEYIDINTEVNKNIQEYFETSLSTFIEKLGKNDIETRDFIKCLHVILAYVDILLMNHFIKYEQIKSVQLYRLLTKALKLMYEVITIQLRGNAQMSVKVALLQCLRDILTADFSPLLHVELRQCIDEDFFHCAHTIVNSEVTVDEEDIYEKDEMENINALRHNCILILAAYCKKRGNYRGQLLDLVLEPKLYNYTSVWDIECAFQCINLLIQAQVDDPPIELIFTLMQNMCKELFRNSKATLGILEILVRTIDLFWAYSSNMRRNCIIMVKGYLQRCELGYYPPYIAALIYESVARIISLNKKQDRDIYTTFKEALIKKCTGDIHSVRIYTCHLMTLFVLDFTDEEIDSYLANLMDIFVIDVAETKEEILKDESANRTITLLHNFYVFCQTKQSLIHKIVTTVLQVQKEKSLDKHMVKKILNKITNMLTSQNIDVYLNNNILSILYFWFLKKNSLNDLPIYLFCSDGIDIFLVKHMKWIISSDALWREEGRILECESLKNIKTKTGNSEQHLVEACFCNIMILCLPYIVSEKYGLDNVTMEKHSVSLRSMQNANILFQVTRQILENEKWSNLFVENMAELVLLTVLHLRDYKGAAATFQVKTLHCVEVFYYPKTTFSAILNYFGELIDGHIMTYLCENQPLIIFNILYKLWDNVLQEKIFEFKVLSLHTYVTTIENIPLGYTSDAFVCNFTCNSVTHAIKICKNKNEIRVLVETLRIILSRFLPDKVDVLRKTVSQALSVLIIKKEEGYETECSSLMQFLVVDIKEYLKESEDVIDFITSLSQGVLQNVKCVTIFDFMEKLKTYNSNLTYPSYETLLNMKQFLKINKEYVNCLCSNSKLQGFSEYCETSVIHQIINSLSNVLKSTSCDKTIIEACNCLAEIGTYDLKTLVTVPPADTEKITNLRPVLHLAMVVLKSLSRVLFDEEPTVTSKAMKALNRLLQYREGKHVLGFIQVDEQIIKPFSSSNSNISAKFEICDEKFNSYLPLSYWIPKNDERHHQWLTRVTTAMLDIFSSSCNYANSLQDVCVAKPDICEKILPSLVGLLLYYSSDTYIEAISEQLNEFFKYIWDMSFEIEINSSGYSDSPNKVLQSIDCDHKSIVKYMLDIVNFVRLQKAHYPIRSRVDPLNYLKLDYDKVAWAATVADQYLTAIYYGELWAVSKNDGVPPSSPEVTTKLNGGENIQRILRKCFVAIGEMEAVEGCGTAHLTREAEILKHLMTTAQHWDALLLHDVALSSGGSASPLLARGIVRSLYAAGMPHLALQYIISMPENDNLDDVKFDCLSYLGDWNTIVDTKDLEEKSKRANSDLNSIIKAFRYACVKDCLNLQISDDSDTRLVKPLNRAKLAVSRLCKDLNMENCQNVYRVVAKLHLFSDIEDYFSVRCANLSICELLNRWQIDKLPSFRDFQHLESLISQRSLILEHAAKSYDNFLKEIVSLQLQYTELGVSNNRIQMAQRLLATAKKLQPSDEVTLAEGQISWAKGHKDIALSLLRNIVSERDLSSQRDVNLTAVSLRQYGIWMAESKYDNARNIIDKYLKKSLEVMRSDDHMETRLQVYRDIAKFADAEYKQVVSYMSSSIFENKLKCMENMRDAACTLRSTQQSLTKDEKKALLTNDRFSALDEAEIASTKAEKERFLQLAMRYYLLSLKHSEANNLSVFRVISLWLENRSLRLDDGDGESFEELLYAIPSRKFLTVLPQLAPRLTNDDTPFDNTLRMIIKRCAKEHPHHTLPILFSLKNSDKDKQILRSSEGQTSSSRMRKACEPRVAAAHSVVTQLASETSQLAAIIAQMDEMCNAMISFANHAPNKESRDIRREIPAAELINKLGPLDAIPIPIDTIPIRNDCNYSLITTIASFDRYYELVGGMNCPKKVVCRGSDGNQRVLLIKGEDDLRQDAVMQQVFSLMNALLERNPVTSRDKLLIRTYKVVAMSRRSGVLEWCEGTTPLGAYLVGNTGAHARYRPQDISANAARTMLNGCYAKKKSNAEKLAVFLKILEHFKPVFHYFFTEHYLDPVTWYERRLAYTKSVAASSMVGYIMGLGDRHVQNILIDKKTAEVIHIDFGIAFDQGKALPTPETVPFRLTQDMIAGFGSSGVEGIFRRCCEKTMQLLRDNQETLLTILEVLLCDPLYSWTVTSAQQNVATTHCMNSAVGGLAERALLSVSSKLGGAEGGAEGGAAGGVAVPGHVARLIHSATDTNNLCRLFPGWQPYL